MTNRITTRKKFTVTMVALLMGLSMSAATQAHDALASVKERYECQKRDLRKAYLLEGKTIRAEYRDALARAAAHRRVAVKLCEPERTLALAQIRAARLTAGECYRDDLALSKKRYRLSVAQLEAWYAEACLHHRHGHVAVVTTRAPRYVVKKTTTYTVPTTVTRVVPTVRPEVVGPRYIEAPVLEAPVQSLPPSAPVYESPQYELIEPEVHEGPVFEGPVLPGPVMEGPVFPSPEPTPGVEFLPNEYGAVNVRPAVRPVRTKTVVRTVSRPGVVPATYTARDASSMYRATHAHGYGDPHGRARNATVGDLVVHALRALAR